MKLEDHDESDGRRAWLTLEEADEFFSRAESTEEKMALGLGLRSGLRVREIVSVTPVDVVDTGAGRFVRVEHGKGDKYRETPLSSALAETISAFVDVGGVDRDEPIVDRSTRWVQRKVVRIREELAEETGDGGWLFLTPHDLRRSWAQHLLDAGVEDGMVMEWGGWENWETFRDAYRGVYSIEKQREERGKVLFL